MEDYQLGRKGPQTTGTGTSTGTGMFGSSFGTSTGGSAFGTGKSHNSTYMVLLTLLWSDTYQNETVLLFILFILNRTHGVRLRENNILIKI